MAETKSRKLLVRDLNEVLVCHLCRGYMVNPTIVDNCYHSYCRSCIVRHLYGNSFCPECKSSPDSNSNGSIDHTFLKSDDTLRSLIYKLIPGLYHKERERSANYAAAVRNNGQNSRLCDKVKETDMGDDEFFAPTEPISLSLEYHPRLLENCRATEHAPLVRYLQCPASVKIHHLKRFLSSKYSLDPQSKRLEVEIMYEDEVLPPEFTLMDVAYCYNWQRHAPMRFTYRILYFGLASETAPAALPPTTSTTTLETTTNLHDEPPSHRDKPAKAKPTKTVSFSDTVDLVQFDKGGKSKSKSAKRSGDSKKVAYGDGGPPPPPPPSMTAVAGAANAPVKVVIARNRSTATDSKKQSSKRNDYRCEESPASSALSSYALSNTASDFKSLRSNDMRYSDYTVTSSSVITAERKKDKERKSGTFAGKSSGSLKSPEPLVVVSIPRGAATNSSSSSSPSDDLFENMSLAQLKTANKKTTPPKSAATPPPVESEGAKAKRNVPKLKIELSSLKSTLSLAPKCKSAEVVDGEPKKQKHRKRSLDEGFVSMSDRSDIKAYAAEIGLKPIEGNSLPSPSSSESLKYSPNASPMSSSGSSTASSTGSSTGSSNGKHYALMDFSASSSTFHKKRKKKHSKDSKDPKDSKRRKLHAEISSQPADESLKMKVKITPAGSGSHHHHHHHHHHHKMLTYSIKAPDSPTTAPASPSTSAATSSTKVEAEKLEQPPAKPTTESSQSKAPQQNDVKPPVTPASQPAAAQQPAAAATKSPPPPPFIAKPVAAVKDSKFPASPPLPPSRFKTTALPFPAISLASQPSVSSASASASSLSISTTLAKPLKEKTDMPQKVQTTSKPQNVTPSTSLFVVPKSPANRLNSIAGGTKFFTTSSSPPGSIASALNKSGVHLKRSASLDDTSPAALQPKSPEQDRQVRKTAYGAFFGNSQMGMPMVGIASAKYLKNSAARQGKDDTGTPSYIPLTGTFTAEYAKRKVSVPPTSSGLQSSRKAADSSPAVKTKHSAAPTTATTTVNSTNSGYPAQLNLVPMSNTNKAAATALESHRKVAGNQHGNTSTDMQALVATSSATATSVATAPKRLMGPPPAAVPKARKFSPLTLTSGSGLTTTPSGTIRSPPLLSVSHLGAGLKGLAHHQFLPHVAATYSTSPPALINLHKSPKLELAKAKASALPPTSTTACLREFRPASVGGKDVHIQEILDLSSTTKPKENSASKLPPASLNPMKRNSPAPSSPAESSTNRVGAAKPPASSSASTAPEASRDDLQNLHLLSESATAREKIAIKSPNQSKLLASGVPAMLATSGAAVVRQQNASVRSIPNPSALAFRNQPVQQPQQQQSGLKTSTASATKGTSASAAITTTSAPTAQKSLNSNSLGGKRSSPSLTTTSTTTASSTGTTGATATLANLPASMRCPKKSTTIDEVAATLNIRAKAALNEDAAATAASRVAALSSASATAAKATPSLSSSPPPPPPPVPPLAAVTSTAASATTATSAPATKSPTANSNSTTTTTTMPPPQNVTTKTIGMGQTVVSLVEEPKRDAAVEKVIASSTVRPPTPTVTASVAAVAATQPAATFTSAAAAASSSSGKSSPVTSLTMNNGGLNNAVSSSVAPSPLTLTLSTEKSQITA